jgi:hypothetical protein
VPDAGALIAQLEAELTELRGLLGSRTPTRVATTEMKETAK